MQKINKRLSLPPGFPPAQREARADQCLRATRKTGFDLLPAPRPRLSLPRGDPAFWAFSYSKAPRAPGPVSSAPHCFPLPLCSLPSLVTLTSPPPGSPPGLHCPSQAPSCGEILPQGRAGGGGGSRHSPEAPPSMFLLLSAPFSFRARKTAGQALPEPPPEQAALSSRPPWAPPPLRGPSVPRINHTPFLEAGQSTLRGPLVGL